MPLLKDMHIDEIEHDTRVRNLVTNVQGTIDRKIPTSPPFRLPQETIIVINWDNHEISSREQLYYDDVELLPEPAQKVNIMQWEYRTEWLEATEGWNDNLQYHLNEWGQEGWEVISAVPFAKSEKFLFIAKRPVAAKSDKKQARS